MATVKKTTTTIAGFLLLLAGAVVLVVVGVAEAAFAIATVMNTKNDHRD